MNHHLGFLKLEMINKIKFQKKTNEPKKYSYFNYDTIVHDLTWYFEDE